MAAGKAGKPAKAPPSKTNVEGAGTSELTAVEKDNVLAQIKDKKQTLQELGGLREMMMEMGGKIEEMRQMGEVMKKTADTVNEKIDDLKDVPTLDQFEVLEGRVDDIDNR